jgi:phosphate starvation-inducible PhoH-like protein
MSEATISIVSSEALLTLFGARDQHLRAIRETLGVSIHAREGRVTVEGESAAVARATELLERLNGQARRNGGLDATDVARALAEIASGDVVSDVRPIEVYNGRTVRPRTAGQGRYLRAIRENSLVFCVGPAGTGKTYLAVAMAAGDLKADRIRKIVLVRPAVEAGESLGFLPGDLQAKINPYLRPLFDALREMMEHDMIRRYMEEDLIEVIPLAYMRGRTLSDAFIILDEAQNTTISQMKMFLTRMGTGSKIVVSGDTTQVDLPKGTQSGLTDALERLRGIDGIAPVNLSRSDIVRHRLVQEIVDAYEHGGKNRSSSRGADQKKGAPRSGK